MLADANREQIANPAWLETIGTSLSTHSHFALSGNLDDLFPVVTESGLDFLPIEDAILAELSRAGLETLLTFDPVDGLTIQRGGSSTPMHGVQAKDSQGGGLTGGNQSLVDLLHAVGSSTEAPLALLVRYASHLAPPGSLEQHRLFVAIDKIAKATSRDDPGMDAGGGRPRTPVLWLLDRPGDLPDWFLAGNHAVRQIAVDLPDLETRYAFARTLVSRFARMTATTPQAERAALQQFALETGGMTLREIAAVAGLASRHGFGLDRSGDALRVFRTGARRNPWASPLLLERLQRGAEVLCHRVKGQDRAIAQTLQILTRSVLGLSGAQASGRMKRPRGVMFFAGPSGVGKTELAKAVTELLFGDEAMCHRFDMTEFNSERSVARLIGAPPGYAGHELGGELTNALRRRPFSVVLFDEVEKAHPRVLDMFLQILDDGRLTDSRGETCHFSDAVIIFTSNVGMLGSDAATNLGMEILPSDSYETLRHKLFDGIQKHFIKDLRRPELLNRIGQNIVAFDFIHRLSAAQIFEASVERTLETVNAALGIEVRLEADVRDRLAEQCLSHVLEGGRGVINRVERYLVNPLAEALLQHVGAQSVAVVGLSVDAGDVRLDLVRVEEASRG
ncbi:AAA family ATPase [Rhodovulum sp. 12E13]|uniref:AAA family ATPase n=1 Tax=Rhodovulum sp. 12E13 TaxID=2203891 RepID=UPI001313EA76|nr:AAA family ATPase [Rhodovulum sp. 12E13]